MASHRADKSGIAREAQDKVGLHGVIDLVMCQDILSRLSARDRTSPGEAAESCEICTLIYVQYVYISWIFLTSRRE